MALADHGGLPRAGRSAIVVLDVARARETLERRQLYTKAAAFGLFFILIYFVGRWDLVGVWLRYGLISGFVLTLIIAQLRCREARLWPRSNLRSLGGIAVNLVLAAVFALPLWQIMADASCSTPSIDLTFPVDNVDWYVGQGGGVSILNTTARYGLRPMRSTSSP
jgi:hypothetical protein